MPRQRTPLAKLEANGAIAHNPKRYKDRKEPKARPLGKPSVELSKKESALWHYYVREASWLAETDRTLLEIVCRLRARMFSKDGLTGAEYGRLIGALSKLGMTPVDRSRVMVDDGQSSSQTPADNYFN